MLAKSICIIDDHVLFREGLKLILENLDLFEQVEQAENGAVFLNMLSKGYRPDLVFMDIDMPGLNGIETTTQAREIFEEIKVVALTMHSKVEYYAPMLDNGVKGYLIKNSEIGEIESAIKYVIRGDYYFSPEILNKLVNERTVKSSLIEQPLTNRENDVLIEICNGLSNAKIADKLNISKRTVDKHRENLLEKTNSSNAVGLVVFAIKNKLISVDDI